MLHPHALEHLDDYKQTWIVHQLTHLRRKILPHHLLFPYLLIWNASPPPPQSPWSQGFFLSLNTNVSWWPFMSHFRGFFSLPEESWESENLYPSGNWNGIHVQNSDCLYLWVLLFLLCAPWMLPPTGPSRPLMSNSKALAWCGMLLAVHLLSENPGLLLVPSLPGYFLFVLYFFFFCYILKHCWHLRVIAWLHSSYCGLWTSRLANGFGSCLEMQNLSPATPAPQLLSHTLHCNIILMRLCTLYFFV